MNDEDSRELDDDESHFQEHSTDEPFLPPADTPHIARRVTSEASAFFHANLAVNLLASQLTVEQHPI